MRKLLITFMVCGALLTGCNRYVVHPGSLNQADSAAYDSLLVAKSSIDTAKAELTSGILPVTAKPLLNNVITAYNVAEAAWHVYHDTSPTNPQLLTTLQTDLNNMAQALVALNAAKQN